MGVLIANKVDLENRRIVSTTQGEEFAKLNSFGYFEVSAVIFFWISNKKLNNHEVDSPFYFLSNLFHENFEDNLKSFIKISSQVSG